MILVAGGTGSLGTRIVLGLRSSGRTVRVLARPTSNAAPLREAGAEIVTGDLRDPGSLARACQGASVVITTASATRTADDAIESVDGQGTRDLIAAATAAGAGQFVLVSTMGASVDSPLPVFRAKGEAEKQLRDGPMSFTILQPNAFMDVWFGMLIEQAVFSGQPVTLVGQARRRHSFVAEQDVAAYAIACIGRPDAQQATLTIGGPEALSLSEVVRIYGDGLGREIEIRRVAPGEPIPGLPLPVWGIAAGLETYDSPVPMEQLSRAYGITPTSARDLVRSRLARQRVKVS